MTTMRRLRCYRSTSHAASRWAKFVKRFTEMGERENAKTPRGRRAPRILRGAMRGVVRRRRFDVRGRLESTLKESYNYPYKIENLRIVRGDWVGGFFDAGDGEVA